GVERLGGACRGRNIVWIASRINQSLGDGAVDEARVEMAQPIVSGKPLAERSLARRCRSVDGNDHVRSAPIERINSTKPGKLVAMNALSSMRTALPAPRPMTNTAIAIR